MRKHSQKNKSSATFHSKPIPSLTESICPDRVALKRLDSVRLGMGCKLNDFSYGDHHRVHGYAHENW